VRGYLVVCFHRYFSHPSRRTRQNTVIASQMSSLSRVTAAEFEARCVNRPGALRVKALQSASPPLHQFMPIPPVLNHTEQRSSHECARRRFNRVEIYPLLRR
jgi:hypothetical protein